MTAGITSTLLTAMAHDLHTAGIGLWRPEGIYQIEETGIVVGAMPEAPNRVVALTPYPGPPSDPATGVTIAQIQARCRTGGPLLDALDLDDAIFHEWQARWRPFGPIEIALCTRWSGPMPIGQDSAGRYEVVSNYQVIIERPESTQEY